MKRVDMLNEDIPINGQAVALISIIGPHMRQKCDVWGIKIKGTASSEEEADKMGKRLQALDPNIDIFRVPVGKFFPLSIDPASADNTIYQDEQLNELIKQNKLNRMQAKDHFEQRKQKMMEDAIREEQNSSSSGEHPVALLDRVNTTESRIKELQKELESLQKTLDVSQLKFNELSVDEKEKATDEFNKINGTTVESIETNNLVEETNDTKEMLASIKTLEEKLEKGKVTESEAIELNTQLNILKGQLATQSKKTNEFINDSFKNSQYNGMF